MTRFLSLSLLLLAVATGAFCAVTLEKTPTEYVIPKLKTPIVIDGKLDEWDMAHTPYIISGTSKDPRCQVMNDDMYHPLKGDSDFSGRVALAWDETYLYIAAAMTDDHLVGVKPDSFGNQGPRGWECDSLMVHLASYRQPMKSNTPFDSYPMLGLRYAPMGDHPRGELAPGGDAVLNKRDLYWILTEHSQWKVAETPNGYNVEAAVPWKDLNYIARPGEKLFIGFLGADVDPGRGLVQIGWAFDSDPKKQALFRLADRDDALAMLTVSQDEVPVNAVWSVRTELESRAGVAKMTALRIIDDKGAVAWTTPVALEVPAGMTGSDLHEITAGAIVKPGRYTVQAITDGQRVIANVPVRITEPVPEAPMIKNRPGEIHHMGPDRVAHDAVTEHREGFFKHDFVKSKEDYVPYIRKFIEPGLKDAAAADIKTKSRFGYDDALRCVALYKITGDEDYVKLARDIMDYTLDAGDLFWFKFTGVMQYRYLTWMKDPNSPFAPKDAEKRLRAYLAKLAEHPSNDLFAESGTHNRVWHRYMAQKVARMVAEKDGTPIDPRVIEYTDYHDKLIGEVGDSDDASANYHWVFFDAAIGIYFFTGDWDGFLKNKGYRKTLSRYVEMVSPSGAAVPFASGSGWPEVGESMWAYELMSALTRDGRFRWTSHRMAEYYYNHLNDRANQYHLPYNTARDNFCLAYLLADDKVAPVPPKPQSRITWRHPMIPVPVEVQKGRPGTGPWTMDAKNWIPDRLVLSSGNDAQALWGLIELLPMAGHGGELPGNIIALMRHDSALFAGQGYYENVPEFQNILWIEDLDGMAADPRPLVTEVPIFVEDPAFTFVRIKTTSYQHLPVTYTRDVFFLKNGFILVKDRAKFATTMKVRLGPCYYARDLGPECGENWFNAYYSQLYYTGLGLGRGVQAIRNPDWDLMVYFSPRAERKHTVLDRYLENPYRNSPIQLRQTWSGMAHAGQEITFTSVLLPHAPMINPSFLLTPPADSKDPKRIEMVQDDDSLTAVKVISEAGETWVMLNDTGTAAEAGPLASNGLLAVIGVDAKGAVTTRTVAGGTMLIFRGVNETTRVRQLPLAPVTMPAELAK